MGTGVSDRHLDRRALAARGRGDCGRAGLHGRHIARTRHRSDRRVRRAPRHRLARRVRRTHRRGKLHRLALGQRQRTIRHTRTGDSNRRHRNRGRATTSGTRILGTDTGERNSEVVLIGLFEAVVLLRAGGIILVSVVVLSQIVRQGIHAGLAHSRHKLHTETTLGNSRSVSAKLAQRDGHLIVEVHGAGVVALGVEINPLGVLVGHIADDTAVVGAVGAVNAVNVLAEDALAPLHLDAGSLGVRLRISLRAVDCGVVQTGAVTAIHPRTVGAVGGDGDNTVELLLPGNAGVPQRAAGGELGAFADGIRLTGAEGDEERDVHGFVECALRQRIVVVRRDHVLDVRHFPHEIHIVVVIGGIQGVQINWDLIHRVRSVHTRVIIGGALRDNHRAIPVGDIAVNGDGLLRAIPDLVGRIVAGEVLHRGGGLRIRVCIRQFLACGAALGFHCHGDGIADLAAAADLDGVTVLEGAGLAFGGGVGGAGRVAGAQGHGHRVGGEGLALRARSDSLDRADLGVGVVEGAHCAALSRTSGNLAAGNGERAAVDLIGVGAIVKLGVRTGEVDVAAHVGDHHTIVIGIAVLGVALDHEAGVLALAVAQVLAVAVHLVAEVVDRHNGLILPHVVAGVTQLGLFGELRVIAAGTDRTVEVQRSPAGTGTDDSPAHAQLGIVEISGFLVAVRIIIMRFNPSDQLIVLRAAVTQARQVAGIQAAAADGRTHGLAVIGGGGAAAIGGVLGEHVGVARIVQAVVTLKHLAVLVLGAVLQNGLPIHRMLRELVRKLDMLGRIEAETVHAVIDCFDEEVLHLVGGRLILGVDIPQAEQMAVRHLPTVAVVDLVAVLARAVGARVEQAGVLPVTADRVPIGREVVGDHVNDDTHAVLVGFSAHILQILLGSHHEIADGRIRRLVDVIPVLSELLTVGQIRLDGAHRLGLHRRVARLGNRLHIVLDGVERPHPCVEDSTVLHVLGQTVLGTCGLEVRVAQRVCVAVSAAGGRGCGRAAECHAAEHRSHGKHACGKFPEHAVTCNRGRPRR